MIWHTLEFIWCETVRQLRRERLIAIATVSTIAVLLVLVGAILLFLLDLRLWPNQVAKQVEVKAFFKKDFDREKAQAAARIAANWPEVEEVEFVSREEGWEQLKGRIASTRLLKGFDASVLPDAMRVKAKSPKLAPVVAKKLKQLPGVEDISDQALAFAHSVVKFQRVVTWTSLVVVLLVGLVGIFIVHNTIRLALHARWREIYIMQLVGATRTLVAAPFVLEGALHGALGAALAACILIPSHMYLRTVVAQSAPLFLMQPDQEMIRFGCYLLLGGSALGITGSAISIRRFLARRPEWHA